LFNLPRVPQALAAIQYDLVSAIRTSYTCIAAHLLSAAAQLFFVAPSSPQSTNELTAVYYEASVPAEVVSAALDPFMISAKVTTTFGNGQS